MAMRSTSSRPCRGTGTTPIEPGWDRRVGRRASTPWGSITRVNPFPGDDKRNLVRRALGFAGFSLLAGLGGLAAGGWLRRADAVVAMSPPLTMGVTGRLVAWAHRSPLVFNIQDVFPDAAVETGAITDRRVIKAASWLERLSYRLSDAVTVLSDDLAANVRDKLPAKRSGAVHTITNFVDTERIRPADRMTPYRAELGIGDEPVVLYAGNVGFSQSVGLLLDAARRLPDVTFLINGEGSMRPELERRASGLGNVRFGSHVPDDRLVELLATGDIHAVPLRHGLAKVERAVQDVLDTRRRPARRRGDRPGHRGAPDPRRVGRGRQRRTGRCGSRSPRRSAPSWPTRAGPRRWVRPAGGGSSQPPRRLPSRSPTRR